MNNNSKRNRLAAAKAKRKNKTTTFQIPHKMAGNHGGDYSFRDQTITIGRQVRLSRRAKVGAAKRAGH